MSGLFIVDRESSILKIYVLIVWLLHYENLGKRIPSWSVFNSGLVHFKGVVEYTNIRKKRVVQFMYHFCLLWETDMYTGRKSEICEVKDGNFVFTLQGLVWA